VVPPPHPSAASSPCRGRNRPCDTSAGTCEQRPPKRQKYRPSVLFTVGVVDQQACIHIVCQDRLHTFVQHEDGIEVAWFRFCRDKAAVQDQLSSNAFCPSPVPPIEEVCQNLCPLAAWHSAEDRNDLLPCGGMMSFR